jgi:hypothetical protein
LILSRLRFIIIALIGAFIDMENPRAINRFLLAAPVVFSTTAVAASIYVLYFSISLGFIPTMALLCGVCGLAAIFNLIIFAPILWLMSKCVNRRSKEGNSVDGAGHCQKGPCL